ncbi:CDP-glucose 4,6-dehydratase [Roseburia inulinivorans]|uniref:CDP-glucose 4,6-dehydratase n=1 Tax=Roseburia inulinivorans TaxID=360807 RepID=A0A414LYK7_9FIRM|nr:CDP-glucose 4,6-dehydratase [Roseburia inulinivorans]RHF00004.1 CDP-glucose 4,6-dehydratase [Roseburia inulinivorans]
MDLSFYKGKKVLVTGHTGFKGSWMCEVLLMQGAQVIGYALEPPTEPSLFKMLRLEERMNSVVGDVRDLEHLKKVFDEFQPEIVIHMAAQPIVRESYVNPVYTYETNVMGTVNVLEAVRQSDCVKSVINVTTDKVYRNNEWEWGYRETDVLDGFDPYSNSKSCSELVTSSYKKSFFFEKSLAVSTCRAGNVIGGGDFAKDRIIPDCVRAMEKGTQIIVRNPYSTRPYQHVLEPVCAYLELAMLQYEKSGQYEGEYNVGPDECDCVTTGELVDLFCNAWGKEAVWIDKSEKNAPHEAGFLKLDCSKIKRVMRWKPHWHIKDAVDKSVEWSKCYLADGNIGQITKKQIKEYLTLRHGE